MHVAHRQLSLYLLSLLGIVLLWPALADASEASLRAQSESNPRIDVRLNAAPASSSVLNSTTSQRTQRADVNGRVLVKVYTSRNLPESGLDTLKAAGLEVGHANLREGMVEGWLNRSNLPGISALGVVHFITLPAKAKHRANKLKSEGVSILSADRLQKLGVDGAGVMVGVISDGVSGLATAEAARLVGPVQVASNPCTPTVPNDGECAEGTAMLELLQDMAPKASLSFCGVDTLLSMENCVSTLANSYGAKIVVDDVGFDDEPIFEDGVLGAEINSLTNNGLLYVSAAGNSHGCHYDADYRPTSGGSSPYDSYHDFGASAGVASSRLNHVVINPGGSLDVVLQWNDSFNASGNDYDLFLVDSAGNVLASSTDVQNGSNAPAMEIVSYDNTSSTSLTAALVVARHAGAQSRHIHLAMSDGTSGCFGITPIQYTTLRNEVTGHPGTLGAIAAGAIDANNSADPTHMLIENYSSWGPQRYDFPALQFRNKPDIAGVDDVSISGAGGFVFPGGCLGVSCFSGTSAAAPHIAGILALLKGNFTGNYLQALTSTATSGGNTDVYGAGRANAFAAAAQLNRPPIVAISSPLAGSIHDTRTAMDFVATCIDPENMATTATWTLPPKGRIVKGGTVKNVKFMAAGNYTATYTCSDPFGATSSGNVAFTVQPATVTLMGQGILSAPLNGKNQYKYVAIDASTFALGGHISVQVTLGSGSSSGDYDVFPATLTPPASGTPSGSLAHAYGAVPGSSTTMTYTFGPGTTNKFKLGLRGDASNPTGSKNAYTYTVTISR